MLRRCVWCLIVIGCGGNRESTSSSASSSGSESSTSGRPVTSSSGSPTSADAGSSSGGFQFGCPNGCPEGTTCVIPDNNPMGTCQGPIPPGGQCCSGGICGVPQRCTSGFVCRARKCQTPLAQGEKGCAFEETVCATGLYCVNDTCEVAGKAGESCTCVFGSENPCVAGLWCSAVTKKCEAPVLGNVGDPCDYRTRQCKDGLICEVESYACDAPPGVCKTKP